MGDAAMMTTIPTIQSVTITPSQQGKFVVEAVGVVGSPGWSNPAITGAGIVGSDGSLQYEFQAEPPHGFHIQVLTEIAASSEFGGPGTSLQGLTSVRVTAQNGEMSASFPPVCS